MSDTPPVVNPWASGGSGSGAPSPPTPRLPSPAASTTSGSGVVNPWASGGGGGGGGASTAAALPAPKKGGGGGWLGSVKGALTAGVHGLAGLGHDLGMVGYRTGQNVVNDVPYLVTAGHYTPDFGPASVHPDHGPILALTTKTSRDQAAQELRTQYPTLEGQRAGLKETGVHALGAGQAVAGAGQGENAPLGRGFQHRTAADYAANPLGATLNDVANVAMVVSPATSALGGAAAEAGTRALEAGSYATSLENAAARGVVSEATAQAARAEAEQLATRAAHLATAAKIVNPAASALERGASVPLLPLQAAVKLGGAGLGRLADTGLAARIADSGLGRDVASVVDKAGTLADRVSTKSAARRAADEQVRTPDLASQRELALNAGKASRLVGRDADRQQAAIAVQTGMVPTLRPSLAAAEHSPEASQAALDQLGMTPRAAKLAVDYTDGNLPAKEATAMGKALDVRTRLVEKRAGSYGSAEGTSTESAARLAGASEQTAGKIRSTIAASRAEEFGNQPLTRVVEEATAKERAAVDTAQQRVLDTQNTPASAQAHAALDVARSRLATAEDAARASTEAAPAPYRPAIIGGQKVAGVLGEHADRLDREVGPGAGDALRRLADETPATLKALTDAGVNPQHLIGVKSDEEGPRLGGSGRSGRSGVAVTKTSDQRQKIVGTLPANFAQAARSEAGRASAVIRNLAAPKLQAMFGKTAADVLPDAAGLSGKALTQAMDKEGWVAWDPSQWKGEVAPGEVSAATTFIPKAAADVFDKYWKSSAKGLHTKFWDWMARGDKGLRLALNPSIHAAYMLGNLVMELPATGPKLIPNMLKAVRDIHAEHATGEPRLDARMLGATFGGVERAELDAAKSGGRFGGFRTPLGYAESKGYALMDLSDKVHRQAIYLTKRGEGFSHESAVRQALSIAGDYQNLHPWEQQVFKRIFPGAAWAKHITQLAMRLPIEHPLRVAWMLNLGQQDKSGGTAPWWMNPFDSAFRVGQLHPAIRAIGAMAGLRQFGADVTPISHAPVGAKGSKDRVALIGQPGHLAHVLERFEPQGKLAQALIDKPIVRYGTGESVVSKAGGGSFIAEPGGKLGAAKAALGFGSSTPSPGLQASLDRTAKANTKASLSYQRRLRAAKNRAPVKG